MNAENRKLAVVAVIALAVGAIVAGLFFHNANGRYVFIARKAGDGEDLVFDTRTGTYYFGGGDDKQGVVIHFDMVNGKVGEVPWPVTRGK